MRRKTSRVSFLMCPFCVRQLVSIWTTEPSGERHDLSRLYRCSAQRSGGLPGTIELLDCARELDA
jgi:hypothetical protein